ncbi:WhiB family transcriptional regulator [Nonomuraea angiospora]|uniref:WhiB family transcriptional regulator n=1 Tax=Nonomuraea angiospora TaxID=46172 RepID=UPI00344B17C1
MTHDLNAPPQEAHTPARERAARTLLAALTEGMPRHLVEEAACAFDPELHTGPDLFVEESAEERAAREQVAREVCADCPVWASCLFYALDARPESGVWAGLTAAEIAAIADQRPQAMGMASSGKSIGEAQGIVGEIKAGHVAGDASCAAGATRRVVSAGGTDASARTPREVA